MKILIFGLPGSGKTTFAKQLTADTDIPHFNADEIKGSATQIRNTVYKK